MFVSLHSAKSVPLLCGFAICLLADASALHGRAVVQRSSAVHASRPDITQAAESADEWQKVSGEVVDATGAVLSAATVELRTSDGTFVAQAQTGKSGSFQFLAPNKGAYRLLITSSGFRPQESTVVVQPKEMLQPLRIVLAPGTVNTTVDVQGREDDLVDVAYSGTQGTVGASQIQDRPMLRAGEILETIPGVIITQHAGGGKANQYFLRGFNLDHGTDFAVFLDGMPLNLPSHAHGEGYSDMNTVITEFVSRVNYEKGPYYADVGNYGSAGAAHLEFFKSLPQNFAQVEGGMYGFGRAVFGVSQRVGRGSLLVGGEALHDDGPWTHPDNYYKFNGLLTYSQGSDANGWSLTARGYHGNWHSSDQIAANAVLLVGYYGTLNPTDVGHSQRYSLQGEWHHQGTHFLTQVTAYGFYCDLDLFSDFTYYLTDPNRGNQFEQADRRWVAGLHAHHTIYGEFLGRKVENTLGLHVRNDWIHNGLFQSEDRVRVDKTDTGTGNTLPATTQEDRFTDTQVGFYAENRIQWASKFRSVLALRGDVQRFDVTSLVTAANSGVASKVLPSPKASFVFGPFGKTEFYAQAGFSFHSNDGRGTTLTVQPVSGDNPTRTCPRLRFPR